MPQTIDTVICCQSYAQINGISWDKRLVWSERGIFSRQPSDFGKQQNKSSSLLPQCVQYKGLKFKKLFFKTKKTWLLHQKFCVCVCVWVKLPPLTWVVLQYAFILGPFWFYSLGTSWGTTSLIHHGVCNVHYEGRWCLSVTLKHLCSQGSPSATLGELLPLRAKAVLETHLSEY